MLIIYGSRSYGDIPPGETSTATGYCKIEIEMLDITGKVIYQEEYKNMNAHFTEQIDLSGFNKGIYLVKVRQADAVYVEMVVVR